MNPFIRCWGHLRLAACWVTTIADAGCAPELVVVLLTWVLYCGIIGLISEVASIILFAIGSIRIVLWISLLYLSWFQIRKLVHECIIKLDRCVYAQTFLEDSDTFYFSQTFPFCHFSFRWKGGPGHTEGHAEIFCVVHLREFLTFYGNGRILLSPLLFEANLWAANLMPFWAAQSVQRFIFCFSPGLSRTINYTTPLNWCAGISKVVKRAQENWPASVSMRTLISDGLSDELCCIPLSIHNSKRVSSLMISISSSYSNMLIVACMNGVITLTT